FCGQELHGSCGDQGYSANQCRTDSSSRSDDGFDFGIPNHSIDDILSKQQGIRKTRTISPIFKLTGIRPATATRSALDAAQLPSAKPSPDSPPPYERPR